MHLAGPLVSLLLPTSLAWAEDPGLLLRYPCDEGSGATLRDAGGRGNDGAVHGAGFAPSGEGWALSLDGEDDFVDCGERPDFDVREAVTVEAWVYPERLPAGEAGIVGKSYESFVLTHYRDGQAWWYISGGGNNCHAPLSLGAWHHLVGTFDGQLLRLYLDGRLAASKTSDAPEIAPGANLWVGKSAGTEEFTRGAHFGGQIDEVRVLNRALSAEEVLERFRTSHLSHELAVSVRAYPYLRRLLLRLDTRGLGALDRPTRARLAVRRAEGQPPLFELTLGPLSAWETSSHWLAFEASAGEYTLTAQPTGGRPSVVSFTWPASPEKGARGMRRLNNLVTELISTDDPGRGPWRFENPREGWVFFRVTGSAAGLSLDGGGTLLTLTRAEPTAEAMRWLPAGEHTLAGEGRLSRLTIRAIPELLFAKFGADPHVPDFGPYDWPFLQRHVLPQLNTMVGNGAEDQLPFAREWKASGRRWIVECMAYGLGKPEPVSPEDAEAFWASNPGLANPLLDGLIVDEFWSGDLPQYPGWTEAVARINASEAFRGKSYYPYCGSMYGSAASEQFMRTVLSAGHRFAWERYLPEQRSEQAAHDYLDSVLVQEARRWEEALPGSVSRMVVCFGNFSAPPESLDVDPSVDHKVYLDMQFHLVANDPAFADVAGLMTYLCSYADEETVRWAGKLFRHYGIEGRADRLTEDPYLLPHLTNGDFEEGLSGWETAPAEPDAITTGSLSGFSWLQGRYPTTSQGDTFLVMQRSDRGPNRLSQTLRRLTPGRVYSLRLFAADLDHLDQQQPVALSISVRGRDPWQPLTEVRHLFPNCYSHHLGPYNDQHRAWMTYYRLTFRATAPEATLELADCPDSPLGQRIALNFVQVQPYDLEGTP